MNTMPINTNNQNQVDNGLIVSNTTFPSAPPMGNLYSPSTVPYVQVRFPEWSAQIEMTLPGLMTGILRRSGYSKAVQNAFQTHLALHFFPHLRNMAQFYQEHSELKHARLALLNDRKEVLEALHKEGAQDTEVLSATLATGELGMVDGQDVFYQAAEEAIIEIVELKEKAHLEHGTFGKGEKNASLVIKMLLGLPLLMVFLQAASLGWTPSTLILAMCLSTAICGAYLLIMRGLYDNFTTCFQPRPQAGEEHIKEDFAPKEPVSRIGSALLVLFFLVLVVTLSLCWTWVDANFLMQVTAKDAWGDENAHRMLARDAFGMAAVFNLLLLLSSLAFIHLSSVKNRAGRFALAYLTDVKRRLSGKLASMAHRVGWIRYYEQHLTAEQENHLHTHRQIAWVRMLNFMAECLYQSPTPERERKLCAQLLGVPEEMTAEPTA